MIQPVFRRFGRIGRISTHRALENAWHLVQRLALRSFIYSLNTFVLCTHLPQAALVDGDTIVRQRSAVLALWKLLV